MREVSQIGCPRHDLPDAHRRKDIIDKQADDKEDAFVKMKRYWWFCSREIEGNDRSTKQNAEIFRLRRATNMFLEKKH